MSASDGELWVFGYGSLMWRPGFPFAEAVHARLVGYRRCFCITSVHHRGNEKRPGLVLGLDRGGVCDGMAFRVLAAHVSETLAYLRARELISGVYREALVPVTLLDASAGEGGNRSVPALAYIAERQHPSYVGRMPLAKQARLIRGARGRSGSNVDYLLNTLGHLAELGIRERELERLRVLTAALVDGEPGPIRKRAQVMIATDPRVPMPLKRMTPAARRRFSHRYWLEGRARLP